MGSKAQTVHVLFHVVMTWWVILQKKKTGQQKSTESLSQAFLLNIQQSKEYWAAIFPEPKTAC